ncbi:hypothetical protein [Massilia phosphatilytica]
MALALLFEQKPEILKKPVQAVHMAITVRDPEQDATSGLQRNAQARAR